MFTEHQTFPFPSAPGGSGGRIPPVTNNCRAVSETPLLIVLIEPRISPTPIQPQQEIPIRDRLRKLHFCQDGAGKGDKFSLATGFRMALTTPKS
jgi:hypothetical protein